MPPPLVLTATPSAVRRRYDLYRLSRKTDDWKPNAVKVRFNLPNTYPQYSDLRINYHCDRSIWWDELKVEGCRIVEAVNTRAVGQTKLRVAQNDRTIVWSFKSGHYRRYMVVKIKKRRSVTI